MVMYLEDSDARGIKEFWARTDDGLVEQVLVVATAEGQIRVGGWGEDGLNANGGGLSDDRRHDTGTIRWG